MINYTQAIGEGQTITKHMDEAIGDLHDGGKNNPLDDLLGLELEHDNYKKLSWQKCFKRLECHFIKDVPLAT